MSSIRVIRLPSSDTRYDESITEIINDYAQIEIIHGKPLPDDVLRRMLPGFRQHGGLIFLAFDAADEQHPVGVATVIRGFSTFYARPLLNVHDLVVAQGWQGRGIGTELLRAVEEYAREVGCCKVTLEVLAANQRAHALYQRLGYDRLPDGSTLEASYFMQKPLLPADE